jgi:hypothetical protein
MVRALEAAPSNLPQYGNGRAVWERIICPERIDMERVLAHHAISLIYRDRQERTRVYCYDLEPLDQEVRHRATSHVAIGRLRIRSHLTTNEAETVFVVIHYSSLDFHAILCKAPALDKYESFKAKLLNLYETGSLAEVTSLASEEFPGKAYHLPDLFVEEQRRIIGIILEERFPEYRQAFEHVADADEDVIFRLGQMRYPMPRGMRTALSVSFDYRIAQAAQDLGSDESVKQIQQILERGKAWDYQPDRDMLTQTLALELRTLMGDINAENDLTALATQVARVLDIAALTQLKLDLWQAQNQLIDAYAAMIANKTMNSTVHNALAPLADRLQIHRQLLGWEP